MGAVVVAFPANARTETTPIRLYRGAVAGQPLRSATGRLTAELPTGTYTLTINEIRVPNVEVKAAFDTRVRTGVLRVEAPPGSITDVGRVGRELLARFQGATDVGVPVGAYTVAVRSGGRSGSHEFAVGEGAVVPVSFATILGAGGAPAGPTAPHDVEVFKARRIKLLDPCVLTTLEALKMWIGSSLASQFPDGHNKDGTAVTLSNPRLTSATCEGGLRIKVLLDVRYQKTRGFPQASASGSARIETPIVVRIQYRMAPGTPPGTPIPVSAVEKGEIWLTNIQVVGLDLANVPNWLDSTLIRGYVQANLGIDPFRDVTPFVIAYLNQGNVLVTD
jgi:hypothetical protein